MLRVHRLSTEEDGSVDNNNDLQDEQSKTNQHESEHLAASVSNHKALMDVFSALFGSSNISVDSDPHADVARNNGGDTPNNESARGVGEGSLFGLYSEDQQDREQSHEPSQEEVLLLQEGDGTLLNIII